ncbi:hypothetical protein NIIDMKKI_75710 [Mycobacterium kansasii]|uniref:Penicillin binding transpeptidase domain protein n=1 Tax=Mycobacterium kansasii TaxID=1768 RepID=A0A7G1IRF8_MYCKA|nr:hypothetical protein NIIDMKKI_75710 [Mycobacterium kansasii]
MADSFPGVPHTLSEDGKGGPPNNGIVLGQYQTRVIDMATAYATLAASGIYHRPHFVQKVVNAEGQVLSTPPPRTTPVSSASPKPWPTTSPRP